MPTSDPLSITSASNATGATTYNAFSELSSEDFVKIMFTELASQDPLDPNDSAALLEQMSSLRSIQSDIDLQNKLSSVVTQNQLSTAGSLIGKYVSGLTEQFQRVVGEVESVSRTADGVVLNLSSGFRVPFDNVDQLLDRPAETGGGDTGGNAA